MIANRYTNRDSLGEIRYRYDFTTIGAYDIFIVLINIFAVNLKQFSLWAIADIKPLSNDLVMQYSGYSCLLSLCVL